MDKLQEAKQEIKNLVEELRRAEDIDWKEVREAAAKLAVNAFYVLGEYPKAKADRKLTYARKWVEFRTEKAGELKEKLGKSPTVDDLKAFVENDQEYQDALDKEAELEGLVDGIKVVLRALELASSARGMEAKYLLQGTEGLGEMDEEEPTGEVPF